MHLFRSVVPHIVQQQQESNNRHNDFSFLFGGRKRQSPHVEIPSVRPVCAAIGYPLLRQPPRVCLVRPQPPVVADFVTEEEQGGGKRLPQSVFSDQRGVKNRQHLCNKMCRTPTPGFSLKLPNKHSGFYRQNQ